MTSMGRKVRDSYKRCFEVEEHEVDGYRIAMKCLLRTRNCAMRQAWAARGTKPADLSRFIAYFTRLPGEEERLNDVIGLGIKCLATTATVEQKRRVHLSIFLKLEAIFGEAAAAFTEADTRADAVWQAIRDEESAIEVEKRRATANSHKAVEMAATEDDYDDVCVICLDNMRSEAYRPCGHTVCCTPCARALWARSGLCPWCACKVEDPLLNGPL